MRAARTAFGLLAAAGTLAPTNASAVTPVQKVLEMLNGMLNQGKKEQEEEKKTFATYSKWVDSRSKELGFEIKTSTSKIETLKAAAEKYDNEVAQLSQAIQSLDEDIARLEADKKAAAQIRDAEKAEFDKLQKDYTESIDALTRAIATVSAQNYDRPQAQMLLQRMSRTSTGMQRVLAAMEQDTEELGAPAADAYDSQTGGVQKMLEGLLKKFKAELSEIQEAEGNKQHYFNLENLHLTDTITHSNADRQEKAAVKASTAGASAKAKGELADTVKALKEQKQFLSDMQSTFKSKSETFAANQKVREDELKAISKAVEIISAPAVSASYSQHVNLAQVSEQGASFLQMASAHRHFTKRQRAAAFLKKRAGSLASPVLASFAQQMVTGPFGKVIELVEGLLAKLKEEAAAEGQQKAWCDEQLKQNKLKRDKQTAEVDRLSALVEQATSQIASMAKQIDTLVKEQADLAKAVQEATLQREKEKTENTATIADAQAGSAAVKQAIVVLKEFYGSQASLLQQEGEQAPEMAVYKGQGGKSGGVLGMLEVIVSDFLRLEAETSATEARAAQEYAKFIADAEADKENKHNNEVKLRLRKDQTEFEKSQTEKDLKANQDELQKANEYFEDLKPTCLDNSVSYEERVARREQEIQSLKEAYEMLNSK